MAVRCTAAAISGIGLIFLAILVIIIGAGTVYFLSSQNVLLRNQIAPPNSNVVTNSYCTVTGAGGLEIRVLSDFTNKSLSQSATISAVDTLICNGAKQTAEITNFSPLNHGGIGWLSPVFPSGTTQAGQLDFIVSYQNKTYDFTSLIPPVGTNCVTLRIPSGNVSTVNVMNGNGSYCQ